MKKNDIVFITLGLTAMALAYTATEIYVPVLPTLENAFAVSIHQVQYTLSSYLFGLAIAQIFAGPIVDRVGYRKSFLPAIIGFILVTIVCAFAPTISVIIIARAFQAFFASVVGITAGASFIHRFTAERADHIFRVISPYVILSGVIAPAIGGYIVYYTNWHIVFLFLALYALLLLIGSYYYFYFTEAPVSDKKLNIRSIWHDYVFVLKNKEFLQCVLINSIYLGVIFSYLTEAPFIYHAYGYTANNIGLTFVPIAFAFLSASQLAQFLCKNFSMTQSVLLALVFIFIGFCTIAVPAFYPTGLSLMTIGIAIAVFGMGFSNPVAFGRGMTILPSHAGTASSLLTALPFLAGTFLTAIVHPVCGNNIGSLTLFLSVTVFFCVGGYAFLGIARRRKIA